MEIFKMEFSKTQDKQLIILLKNKIREEQNINLEIIELLREVQKRRLYSDFGCSSLFDFCVQELNYSEHQAYRRLRAMNTIKEIPKAINNLRQGDLSLTTLNQLGQFVKANKDKLQEKQIENLLVEMKGQSKSQTQKLLKNKSEELNLVLPDNFSPQKFIQKESADGELRIHLTLTVEEKELLKQVQGLLGHSKSKKNNNEKSIIVMGLELLKENLEKKKFAVNKKKLKSTKPVRTIKKSTKNPTSKNQESSLSEKINQPLVPTRTITASIKREVYQRAEGRCEICNSFHALEIDHVIAYSMGGTHHDSENLRLLCKSCNQRAAIKTFGQKQMDMFINI